MRGVISNEDIQSHPEAVIDVLEFNQNSNKPLGNLDANLRQKQKQQVIGCRSLLRSILMLVKLVQQMLRNDSKESVPSPTPERKVADKAEKIRREEGDQQPGNMSKSTGSLPDPFNFQSLFASGDPKARIVNIKKIGEGYATLVYFALVVNNFTDHLAQYSPEKIKKRKKKYVSILPLSHCRVCQHNNRWQ